MENSEEKFLKGYAEENAQESREAVKIELTKAPAGMITRTTASPQNPDTERENPENEPEGQLTIDVYQTPTEIIIESPVAGVSADNLDVNVTADAVTIKGYRERTKNVRDEDYIYQECYWGRFSRSIILPQEIDAENSYASFKSGVLTVHLPKLTRTKAKRVKVKLE